MPKTRDEKIRFIRSHVNSLPLDSRREVGKIIYESGVKLHECGRGSVIDLDLLSPNTVALIYQYIKFVQVAQEVAST